MTGIYIYNLQWPRFWCFCYSQHQGRWWRHAATCLSSTSVNAQHWTASMQYIPGENNIRIMLWKGLNNDSLITCMLRSFDNWIMENNETGRVRCFKFTDVIIWKLTISALTLGGQYNTPLCLQWVFSLSNLTELQTININNSCMFKDSIKEELR